MVTSNFGELDEIRKDCKQMVVQRAAISGVAGIVPVPGVDIATDIGLLMQLLPAINRRFGLSPEQIEKLDSQNKLMVYSIITNAGANFAGKVITKQLIVTILKRVGIRVGARQVAKYVPLIGQGTAAAISFGAMKMIGDLHVNECYEISKKIRCH